MMHWTSPYRTPPPRPSPPIYRGRLGQPPSCVQGPPSPSPASQPLHRDPQPWPCMPLYMFKFVQVGLTIQGHLPAPQPGMFKLVYYEPHMESKRAVRILLECFLVESIIVSRVFLQNWDNLALSFMPSLL